MAIKGKKKKGGSGRNRTSAPKHPIVERRTPFLRRTGVLFTAVALVGTLVGFALGWGMNASSTADTVSAQGKDQVKAFKEVVDPILAPLGSATPSGAQNTLPGMVLFPQMSAQIGDLKAGRISVSKFGKSATDMSKAAKNASDSLNALRMTDYAGGLPTRQSDEMYAAQMNMAQSLTLYSYVADLLESAANVGGKARDDLAKQALDIQGTADSLFQTGFSSYLGVLDAGGVATTAAATAPSNPAGQPPVPPTLPPNFPSSP